MYKVLNLIWILAFLGTLSVTFAQEQEVENELGGDISSEMVEESPCELGKVQVQILGDGSVHCVEEDVAESWILGNYAVMFDAESEQETEVGTEAVAEEAVIEEAVVEEEALAEVEVEEINTGPCDLGRIQVKLIEGGAVVCAEEHVANSWVETNFAVIVNEEPQQEQSP